MRCREEWEGHGDREGYLGISEVDVDVAGDCFYIIIAGDQGERPGDRDVDELVEGHLGPVDRRISELGP